MEQQIISMSEGDNDATFMVRRNGKTFYTQISPSNFVNSPATTQKYKSYLEVIRSGEEVLGEIYDVDVYDWVMAPFGPLLIVLAPDPWAESVGNIRVTLKEYLYPAFFLFILDIIDEKLSSHWPLCNVFDDDFLDDLESWPGFYDPAGIIISHKNPEDTFEPPKKVLTDKGQTACFFKRCRGSVPMARELKTYKKIHAAGLDSQVNLCHMHGILMDENNSILGLLLTHIDGGRRLSNIVIPEEPNDPPRAIGERWREIFLR